MAYKVKTLCDATWKGSRLWIAEVTHPRFIQAELKTHRSLTGNAGSSRALKFNKMVANLLADPVMPNFQKDQAGMTAAEFLTEAEMQEAQTIWLKMRDFCIEQCKILADPNGLNIAKQWVNRPLEPWMWITNIVSGTDWNHFFKLRTAKDAQPEFKIIADLMYDEYHSHKPHIVTETEAPHMWTLPLVTEKEFSEDWTINELKAISVGKVARVSYLTHEGVRDSAKDIELHDRLKTSGHFTPFEHIARPVLDGENPAKSNFGPFWHQYRKDIPNEHVLEFTKI